MVGLVGAEADEASGVTVPSGENFSIGVLGLGDGGGSEAAGSAFFMAMGAVEPRVVVVNCWCSAIAADTASVIDTPPVTPAIAL